jgi:hypothetical protein
MVKAWKVFCRHAHWPEVEGGEPFVSCDYGRL